LCFNAGSNGPALQEAKGIFMSIRGRARLAVLRSAGKGKIVCARKAVHWEGG
jgi:hypothetical protein